MVSSWEDLGMLVMPMVTFIVGMWLGEKLGKLKGKS